MKRHGHLYPAICSAENIARAHLHAKRGKAFYHDVKAIEANPGPYLATVRQMLVEKTYTTSPYLRFTKTERGKTREIYALPYFPDRIIQWAIVQVLEPIWMETLVPTTYASLPGRGIHAALVDVHTAMQDGHATRYCLKLDVRKFYPSIDHDILKAILRQKIKDPDVLALLDDIIDSAEGVPIGNYLSQYFGNLYLSGLDHYVKEGLGVRHYFRYCDDFVLLHADKAFLHDALERIRTYLAERLRLTVKPNYQIFPTRTRGLDFVGYRFFGNYILLRKSSATALKRKLAAVAVHEALTPHDRSVVASYAGLAGWCDSHRLAGKYIAPCLRMEVHHL